MSFQSQTLLSREQVLEWFEIEGLTVMGWAKKHHFHPQNVYAVLAGRSRGRRGEAHEIAKALRMKPAKSDIHTQLE